MFLNTCPFCEHGNPPDSKFCNACGGALHLLPCPRCGAVNDVTATACYQCHGRLPGCGTNAPEPGKPGAEVSRPLSRPHSRVIIGTAVVVAISILGYFSYNQRWLVNTSQLPTAGSEASGRGSPTDAGVMRRDAATGDTVSVKAEHSAGPASPATAPPESLLAGPTRAVAIRPRAGREAVEAREAKVVAAPSARAKAINTGRASEQGLSRPEACTEAVAALGLCTFRPVEKKETDKAVLSKAEIARPQTAAAGKAAGEKLPRGEACTTAAAALGLCAPGFTQEGK